MSKSPSLPDVFDSSSKTEGRDSSHLELVERADPSTAARHAPEERALGWKMKSLIGAGLGAQGLMDWYLLDHINSNANQASATPASSGSGTPSGNSPQQNYGSYPPVSHLTQGTQQTTDSSLTDATQQSYGNQAAGYPPNYGTQTTNQNQQYSTGQQTSTGQPPSTGQQTTQTNNGPNSRREERPRGRRSPVDIPSELHSKSRIDAVADVIVTNAGI